MPSKYSPAPSLCECGCGNLIEEKVHHREKGTPRFISGHNSRGTAQILQRTCPYCQKNYTTRLGSFYRAYCSRACANVGRVSPGRVRLSRLSICGYCLIPFYRKKSRATYFCCRACAFAWSREYGPKGSQHPMAQKRGAETGNWRGGRATVVQQVRQSVVYREWRTAVYRRDNYRCQDCGDAHGRNLNAHHIIPISQDMALAYAVDNGVTLCETCHTRRHTGPRS